MRVKIIAAIGVLLGTTSLMAVNHAPEILPHESLWVANGLDDTLSIFDLASSKVAATLDAGINSDILGVSATNQWYLSSTPANMTESQAPTRRIPQTRTMVE